MINHLTIAERSFLLYLLKAIQSAPYQSSDLIKIAIAPYENINYSNKYLYYLDKLQRAENQVEILEVARKIKEEIL